MKNFDKLDVREKTMEYGISYPFDEELVMLILGSGTKEMPINVMAKKIVEMLDECGDKNVVNRLMSLKGVGESKALAIAAAIELGRRRTMHLRARIENSHDLLPYVKNYAISNKEHFLSITLNGGHEIIQIHVVSVGTLNRSIIHPREIFMDAIKEAAAALIVCHNHPSGDCEPSETDIATTQMLVDAANVIGIRLLDHIIISCEEYYSFAEHKLLFTTDD